MSMTEELGGFRAPPQVGMPQLFKVKHCGPPTHRVAAVWAVTLFLSISVASPSPFPFVEEGRMEVR